MRVLAVTPLYPPGSLVGSWISTHECLAHLAERGHQVDVIQYMARRRHGSTVHEGVTVRTRSTADTRLFDRADVVVCHLGDNGLAARLAARRNKPLVRMVHSTNTPESLDGACLAVFNSTATLEQTGWTGPSIVVHPPVRPERYRTDPGDRVTLVNLAEEKGGNKLWRLADLLPGTKFLGVRGGYGRQVIHRRPNVDVITSTPDMRREVYARTGVLIMPSVTESWGRVAIEAACSGIPTIAHPTPGLVEALGPAGIFVDRVDIAGWVAELRRLEDPDEWSAASAAATARAHELDPAEDLDRFANALEGVAA